MNRDRRGVRRPDRERITVGEIVGTHGYRGEVKVVPHTDFPERFLDMDRVWVQGPKPGMYGIEGVRRHKSLLLFKLAGINSREEGQAMVKGLLQVEENEVVALPAGTYYVFQLEGLQVNDTERGTLGVLTEVLHTGANDVYVVCGERFGEVLIPALKEVIREVNLQERTMTVSLLPGLLEED